MEVEIYEELNSGETLKQINALSKLNLYWINLGKDPTLFYPSILKIIQETNNNTARILCYNALKSCKGTTGDWANAIPLLVKDLASDDSEVVISILKTLPTISHILTELLMMGNADFGHLVRHQNQSVRKVALDTLTSLLFYKKSVLSNYKSFVSTGWDIMVDRLLEEPIPGVYQSAFSSISNLFSEVSRSVSLSDEADSNQAQRRQTMSHYADLVCAKLVDHFDVLLARAGYIDISQRHVTINTLTYVADCISRASGHPYWPNTDVPKLSSNKQKSITSPQNVVSILVDSFISVLGSTNDALVFSAGKAILDLLLTQQNQHNETWINPVLTAFVGLLRREGVTLNPLPILLAIMSVLPMLSDDLLYSTLTKILPSIKSISDSNQRVTYLIRTFELVIERHVTSSGKTPLFNPLMQDPVILFTMQDDSSSFREEILISLVSSHHNILSKILDTETDTNSGSSDSSSSSSSNNSSKLANSTTLYYLHQAALNICEQCVKCVYWSDERRSAIEYIVRFIDWLCRVTLTSESPHSTKLVSLLRSELLEQVQMIPSDYICLQSIFLLCQHLLRSPSNKVYEQSDAALIIGVIRRRFLFLDNQPKYTQFNGSIREMLMGVSQYSRASPAHLHSLSGLWLGALESLYLLGLHIPSAESTVLRTLDDVLATYPHNKSVFTRARFIKRILFGSAPGGNKFSTIRNLSNLQIQPVDFSYCIPIESLETSNSLRNAGDIFAYECKKAISGLGAGVHYGSSIHDRPSREVVLVSGPSDPVWVELYHTPHPTLHTVTLYIQVTNVISFTIKNITVTLGTNGHIDIPYQLTQLKYQIPKLLPDKTHYIEVPLQVTGLDLNTISITLTYSHPSGIGEIEALAPSKREKSNSNAQGTNLNPSNTSSNPLPNANTSNISPNQTTTTTNHIPTSLSSSTTNNSTTSLSSSQQSIHNTNTSNSASNLTVVQTPTPNPSLIGPASNIPNQQKPPQTVNFEVPFVVHCVDYQLEWNQFLQPFKYNKHQFLQQWPRFEASYTQDIVFEGYTSPQLITECLNNYPLHNVQACYFSNSNFQLSYSANTWFNDQFCFTVSGMERSSQDQPLEYTNPSFCNNNNTNNLNNSSNNINNNNNSNLTYKVFHCRFEFKSTSSNVLASFQNIIDQWIYKIPRAQDNFLARVLAPGEESIFTITKVQDKLNPNENKTIMDELQLLANWKEKKGTDQSKKLFTQLALEQDNI